MHQTWSRKLIVDGLVQMHQEGYRLRSEEIANYNTGLHNAIYYRTPEGKRKYFVSLAEARTAVAERLHESGDTRGAKKVMRLNEPLPSSNKYSKLKRKKIMVETLAELQRRIKAEEDVSLRYLRETDRPFANRLERYIGYREAFKALHLNAADYAHQVKHRKEHYLGRLIRCIRRGEDLDRLSVEAKDPNLVASLNQHYHGYYRALQTARDSLLSHNKPALATRADPEHWKSCVEERNKKRITDRLERATQQITVIDSAQEYSAGSIGPLTLNNSSIGRDIAKVLQSSDEWLTSREIATRFKTTQINVSKNLPLKFPTETILYRDGERNRYFFHCSLIDEYKKTNTHTTSPRDSLNRLAQEKGTGYSKMRSIADNLSLGIKKERHRSLSKEDVATVSDVLEREKELRAGIIASIDPSKEYTLAELELRGIPISHFDRMIRAGKLKPMREDLLWSPNLDYLQIDPTENKNVRSVSGRYALDYLQHHYSPAHLSQGLRLITYFHPHLYTSSDLITRLGLNRSIILHRLSILRKENPDACFRIRKSDKRSRTLITDEAIPFLQNWSARAGLQVISLADKLNATSTKHTVQQAVHQTKKMLDEESRLNTSDTLTAFEVLHVVENFLRSNVEIDGIPISQKDVARIYHYMIKHSYQHLELQKKHTLHELREILNSSSLVQDAADVRQKLGRALQYHYSHLITGVSSDLYVEEADKALIRAIELFDSTRGVSFEAYASTSIRRSLERKKYQHGLSLQDHLGQDSEIERINFIADETQQTITPITSSEAEQGIRTGVKSLLTCLSEKQKRVIIERFGLQGRKRKTLEEIGEIFGVTRESIRQLEAKALRKLSRQPDAKLLREYLE